MDRPLLVEILAYAPTAYYHCTHCEVFWRETGFTNQIHDEQVQSSLPADLADEYQTLTDWVQGIIRQHCDRVSIKVIDVASVEGLIKSLKYGVRRYPAIVIDGKKRYPGGDFDGAGDAIAAILGREEVTTA